MCKEYHNTVLIDVYFDPFSKTLSGKDPLEVMGHTSSHCETLLLTNLVSMLVTLMARKVA